MQEITQIGNVPWNRDDIRNAIPDFLELYAQRPVEDNSGGMRSPHMFTTWFLLSKLRPANIIESGVWKGQGTWLMEKTLPETKLHCVDPNLHFRKYISPNAVYYDKDLSLIDWSHITDKENTLVFIDDHQNALDRIRQGLRIGFKQFIFEDNYPAKQGDCYTLKKAFQHAGFTTCKRPPNGIRSRIKELLGIKHPGYIAPNAKDAAYLKDVLEVYYEIPPVFKKSETRWNDAWNEEDYPTPDPLYTEVVPGLELFDEEAKNYTWMCYAKLK